MGPELLEIHPRELTFVFELKKQSSDSIQLFNNSDQYVAFKVKTTSPKKYCVRPNIGVIKPKSTCDFTVTMQAQREAPPYMQCKDKFLIQSTIIPYGTKEEDITSDLFAKSGDKYIEERKLRVVLVTPSPEVIPVNGNPENELPDNGDQVYSGLDKPLSELTYKDEGPTYPTDIEVSAHKHGETIKAISEPNNVEITPGTRIEEKSPETKKTERNVEPEILKETVDPNYLQATVEANNGWAKSYQNAESNELEDLWAKPSQNVEASPTYKANMSSKENLKVGDSVNLEELGLEENETDQKSIKDVECLKLKLNNLKLQLNEAERTITKLGDEHNNAIKEKEMLKQELALLRQTSDVSVGQVYDGFPLLFVVMVALVSLVGGCLLRP
uniref:MSP domain-containing protein n=1 Tax=Kalanchoe fedtschenkoi TaxID=63787 RepID=A0A7N0UMN9_KALFE